MESRDAVFHEFMKVPYTACIPVCVLAAAATLGACAGNRAVDRCARGGCTGDAQLTAQVEARLYRHPELRPPNLIYVRAHNGVVYLSGEVSTELQREIAVATAQQVPGERRVLDDIGIEYTGR
jgi:osmotically-inducible protein OsmY